MLIFSKTPSSSIVHVTPHQGFWALPSLSENRLCSVGGICANFLLRVDGGKKFRRALAGPTGEQYKLPSDLGDNCESNSLSMAISGCVIRVPTSSYVSAFMCDGPAGRLLSDKRAYDLLLIRTLHALEVF